MFTARRTIALLLASAAPAAACEFDAPPQPETPAAQRAPNVSPEVVHATTARAITPAAPIVLPADKLAEYRAALPRVAYRALQDIFDSPSTLWWDKETITPSYQDTVGDGSYTPIGARANSQGRGVIVPEGKRLFSADGQTWSFPFATTAGTDRSTNIFIINFLSLPVEAGAFFPVVYSTIDNNSALGGLGLHRWTWMYPKGTTIGEVIFIRDAQSALVPVEVRIRQRYLEGWSTNAFRPFPTAAKLADAIRTARPDYALNNQLRAFVDHLENTNTLTPSGLTSPDFNNIFTIDGNLDVLPAVGDAALVRRLLTTTTFISAYASVWKANGAEVTFAASTAETFSFVPNNYDAGLLEVRESTCTRCHEDAGRLIDDFEPAAILYGDIWGQDRVFSFHPWDESRYASFNHENREVRPELASVVVPYDASVHTADRYRELQ